MLRNAGTTPGFPPKKHNKYFKKHKSGVLKKQLEKSCLACPQLRVSHKSCCLCLVILVQSHQKRRRRRKRTSVRCRKQSVRTVLSADERYQRTSSESSGGKKKTENWSEQSSSAELWSDSHYVSNITILIMNLVPFICAYHAYCKSKMQHWCVHYSSF